jgi:hypothetical protein
MPDPQMSSSEFAAKIKAKYPDYASIPDTELIAKMITKYPEYRDKVSFGAPQQNYSAMSPQQLASQAMSNSGITGNQRLAASAPQVNMQQQPTMAGAYANSVADNVSHAKNIYSAFGQDVKDLATNPRAYVGGPISGGIDALTTSPQQPSATEALAGAAGINAPAMAKAAQNRQYDSMAGHSLLPLMLAFTGGKAATESGVTAGDLNPFPSRARAGETFAAVKESAGNIPIDVNAPGEVALRTQQLASSGGSMPKVVRDFIRRVTDPEAGPLTYSEARDFYSNATRLSADEFNRLTPVMKKQVGEFTSSLNDSITGAAAEAGKKAEYLDAMGEYAAASRWRNRAAMLGKVAAKTLPYVAAGYTVKKVVEGR